MCYKDQKNLWSSDCICNVNAAFLCRNQLFKTSSLPLSVASRCLLSWPWGHQEMYPLPVGPGDAFLSLGPGSPFLNYFVGVPTRNLSSALSPCWISDLCCSFVSGPVSCYSWLNCLDRSWTWFITSAHLWLSVEPAVSPWLCSTSSGAAELCLNWWRCCSACGVVTPTSLSSGAALLLLFLTTFCVFIFVSLPLVSYSAWWKLVSAGL